MTDPEGWDPQNDQFNLPFTVELKENFHLHWQDMRIEMMPDDFETAPVEDEVDEEAGEDRDLDDAELTKIDQRTDGEVEGIDVKLNNRKTKKIGSKKDDKSKKIQNSKN